MHHWTSRNSPMFVSGWSTYITLFVQQYTEYWRSSLTPSARVGPPLHWVLRWTDRPTSSWWLQICWFQAISNSHADSLIIKYYQSSMIHIYCITQPLKTMLGRCRQVDNPSISLLLAGSSFYSDDAHCEYSAPPSNTIMMVVNGLAPMS